MFQMHSKKRKEALHEPTVWSPGFSRSGPPEGGTPKRSDDPDGFMFPMHSKKRKGALHEPWMRRADIPVYRFGRLSSRPILKHGTGMSHEPAGWKACATSRSRFMVPMHAEKRKGAFHEPPGRAGCPQPAGRGAVRRSEEHTSELQ